MFEEIVIIFLFGLCRYTFQVKATNALLTTLINKALCNKMMTNATVYKSSYCYKLYNL